MKIKVIDKNKEWIGYFDVTMNIPFMVRFDGRLYNYDKVRDAYIEQLEKPYEVRTLLTSLKKS